MSGSCCPRNLLWNYLCLYYLLTVLLYFHYLQNCFHCLSYCHPALDHSYRNHPFYHRFHHHLFRYRLFHCHLFHHLLTACRYSLHLSDHRHYIRSSYAFLASSIFAFDASFNVTSPISAILSMTSSASS